MDNRSRDLRRALCKLAGMDGLLWEKEWFVGKVASEENALGFSFKSEAFYVREAPFLRIV